VRVGKKFISQYAVSSCPFPSLVVVVFFSFTRPQINITHTSEPLPNDIAPYFFVQYLHHIDSIKMSRGHTGTHHLALYKNAHRSTDPGGREKTRKSERKFYFTQRTTTRNKKMAQASKQGGSEARNATSERARERQRWRGRRMRE